MREIKNSGKIANTNGKFLEEETRELLLQYDFYELTPEEKTAFVKSDGDKVPRKTEWFTTQCRLEKNLYGAKHSSDIIAVSPSLPGGFLHIECKYQHAGGSIDEKYVFTVLSLKGFSRGCSALILDGGGTRQCAVAWIKRQEKTSKKKFYFFQSYHTFSLWLKRQFENPQQPQM